MCMTCISLDIPGAAQDTNLVAIQILIRQSKLDDADSQLQAILQKQPTNAKALTMLGIVRRQQGNWPEAETAFRRSSAAAPQSLEACESLANLLRDETRWPEAVTQYEKCRKLAPRNFNIAADLAIAYQKNGDYSKSLSIVKTIPPVNRPQRLLPVVAADYVALKDSQNRDAAIAEVLRHAPSDPELVPALANSFLDHGMTKDAADMLQIARPHQKVTPSFLCAVARAQAASGQIQEARQSIDQAIRLNPKSQDTLGVAASLAILWGQWDKALEFLDAALAAGPPRTDLLQSVVFAELRKPDLQAAHAVAQRWYELRPEETAGALAYAVVLVEGNHWGEAKPLLEKVLSQSPNDKGAQLAMGVVRYNAGDLAASKQYLTASIGGPDDGNARYFLGLIAKQQGDYPEAIVELEQSVAVQPHNPRAFGQLGQLYLQQNDLPKARAVLEKAIEQAPDEPQNHYELARVYNKLDLKAESEEQLKLYQKLRPQRPQPPQGEPTPQQH
jgi:tetratricopeptide (TPR) repeat protein